MVTRFSGYVFAILSRGFGLTGHAAEDIFQETFARLYERIDTVRDDAAIRGWIAQTARRLAIDRHRGSGGRETPVEPEEFPDDGELDAQLETLDDALTVRAGLAALSEDCNEMLTRFFIRDETYRTISEATGVPGGTVASRISRCLGKLREKLEGRNPEAAPSGTAEAT
jgi:RNA polymerase sigma factor (sigma-70 family)